MCTWPHFIQQKLWLCKIVLVAKGSINELRQVTSTPTCVFPFLVLPAIHFKLHEAPFPVTFFLSFLSFYLFLFFLSWACLAENPWSHYPPALPCQVWGLQVCPTILGSPKALSIKLLDKFKQFYAQTCRDMHKYQNNFKGCFKKFSSFHLFKFFFNLS